MKQTVLFILSILLFCSCGKSKEEKADALIKKYLLEELHNCDNYSPIESKFEKAYNIALNDSACRKYAINIVNIRNDYQEGMRIFTHQMEEAGLFTKGQEMNGYYKGVLKRYPEIFKTHKMIETIDATLSDQISLLKNSKPIDNGKHIGYSVNYKFQYKDSFEKSAVKNYYFLFDKQLKNILCAINLEDEANKSMIDVLDQYCSDNKL